MKSITLSFLSQIIKEDSSNYFAKEVFRIIKAEERTASLKRKFIDIIPISKSEPTDNFIETEATPENPPSFRDYRFNYFKLNGFRKFPYNDKDYGIDFAKKDIKNVSLFLIGNNGSGKTTLFSGLEYLCTGKISAAEQRNVALSTNYLNYGKEKGKTFQLTLSTVQADITNSEDNDKNFKEISHLLKPFFCSENDILEISSYKQDLTHFIYDQTGLKMSVDLLHKLKQEREDAREVIDNYINELPQKETFNPEIQEKQISFLNNLTLESFKLWEYWEKTGYKNENSPGAFTINTRFWNVPIPNEYKNKKAAIEELTRRIEQYLILLEKDQNSLLAFLPHECTLLKLYSDFITQCKSAITQNPNNRFPFSVIQPYNTAIEEQYNQIKRISFDEFEEKRSFYYKNYLSCWEAYQSNDNQKKADFLMNTYKESTILTQQLEEYRKNSKESIESKYNRYNNHYGYLNHLIKGLEQRINNQIELFYRIGHRFVEETLESFMEIDEKFKLELKDYQIIPLIEFTKTDGNKEFFTPREFFNSFRFKMYCLGLKIAVAFSIKKYMNFNFPLILDDVFYSSDFTNREKVEEFIRILYEVHDTVFERQKELQILFLTHDELLISAATNSVPYRIPILSGRLFDYREFTSDSNKSNRDDKSFTNLYESFSV